MTRQLYTPPSIAVPWTDGENSVDRTFVIHPGVLPTTFLPFPRMRHLRQDRRSQSVSEIQSHLTYPCVAIGHRRLPTFDRSAESFPKSTSTTPPRFKDIHCAVTTLFE